jgi:hypothetical protein
VPSRRPRRACRPADLCRGLRCVWLRAGVRPDGWGAGAQYPDRSRCKAYTAARMGVDTSAFAVRLRRDNVPASSFCDDKLTDLPGGSVVKDGGPPARRRRGQRSGAGGGSDDLGDAGRNGSVGGGDGLRTASKLLRPGDGTVARRANCDYVELPASQSSVRSPSTRLSSRKFPVTTIKPRLRAWPAISVS